MSFHSRETDAQETEETGDRRWWHNRRRHNQGPTTASAEERASATTCQAHNLAAPEEADIFHHGFMVPLDSAIGGGMHSASKTNRCELSTRTTTLTCAMDAAASQRVPAKPD
ncbi:MAG: hypothetical protein LWW81_11260 [Rhodocyclales bacterium]|nr:hypothetical protein [Rhodocyclales bacterium]